MFKVNNKNTRMTSMTLAGLLIPSRKQADLGNSLFCAQNPVKIRMEENMFQ